MVDLVMTFNVAIISAQNKLVLDRKVIAITYLKSWFLLDLAASVPFDLIIQAASSEDDLSTGGEGSNTASATSLLKGFKVSARGRSATRSAPMARQVLQHSKKWKD